MHAAGDNAEVNQEPRDENEEEPGPAELDGNEVVENEEPEADPHAPAEGMVFCNYSVL